MTEPDLFSVLFIDELSAVESAQTYLTFSLPICRLFATS